MDKIRLKKGEMCVLSTFSKAAAVDPNHMIKHIFIGQSLFFLAVESLVPKPPLQIQKTSQRKINDRKLSQQSGKKKNQTTFGVLFLLMDMAYSIMYAELLLLFML